eukprot:scpid21439/ scgid3916/ Transient receptor potential cation channel subfamily A member 1; Ankyrin-like with transmembrane domains protein 1; Transformation-sensitive protein p120
MEEESRDFDFASVATAAMQQAQPGTASNGRAARDGVEPGRANHGLGTGIAHLGCEGESSSAAARPVTGTPQQYRRRLHGGEENEMELRPRGTSLSKTRRRVEFSRQESVLDSSMTIPIPMLPTAAVASHTISTVGAGNLRKVKYKRNVSYPSHEADHQPGGESGNESDEEEDDEEFWKEVREKSKGMMMYKAAKQTTRLERMFKRLGNSWDRVLLDVVDHGFDVEDGRDMKFSLNLLLHTHSASVDATDEGGDTALHCAARSGKLEAVEILLQSGASTTARNNRREIPLLLALRKGHDAVAAKIMACMQPARVRDIFIAHGNEDCVYSFHHLIEEKEMKESLTAALDCMVKKLHDQPNHFKFFLQILDGDSNGRHPRDAQFTGRTALQLIAKFGNKTAVYHNVVRILLWHKWKQFVSRKYWMQAAVFSLYVVVMSMALIFAGDAVDPTQYRSALDIFRAICEVLSVLFCLYGLAAECNQLYKHRGDYFEDLYNYVDVTSFSLILVVIPLRFTDSSSQWTVASFAYVATCIRFFKYTCAFRNIGAYTQILGRIVRIDIVRFMIIFCIFLVTFSGSFYLALRGEEEAMFSLKENRTVTISDLDKPDYYHARSYPEILLTGLRIMIESEPIIDYYERSSKLGWLGIVLILLFMFIVIVVLLNILIAQLSDTYQNVQSDAQREVELNRAYIVGHVEKNSLLYKNLLATNYKPFVCVRDPVNVLERWECPPLNDLHRQLHRMSNRLEHYDSSFVTLEHTLSHQTRVLEELKTVCMEQTMKIQRLHRKLKRRRGTEHGVRTGASKDSITSSDSESDSAHGTRKLESEDVEDDELGGVVHTRHGAVTSSSAPIAASAVSMGVAASYQATVSGILPGFAAHRQRLSELQETTGHAQAASSHRQRSYSAGAAELHHHSRSPRQLHQRDRRHLQPSAIAASRHGDHRSGRSSPKPRDARELEQRSTAGTSTLGQSPAKSPVPSIGVHPQHEFENDESIV